MKKMSGLKIIFFMFMSQLCVAVVVIRDPLHPYTVCQNVSINDVSGSELEREISELRQCEVIEGYLEIVDVTLNKSISFPSLVEVTDYIVLYFLQGAESIAKLFPRLSVIRGRALTYHYALVSIDNHDLREIGPWSLKAIMRGAVRLENNILMCIDSSRQWSRITDKTYHDLNYFKNNFKYCPFNDCEEEGWCPLSAESCRSTDSGCFLDNNCHNECLGGCTSVRNSSSCAACKNFRLRKQCVKTCPKNMLQFMDYRCITRQQCLAKKWVMFNSTLMAPSSSKLGKNSAAQNLISSSSTKTGGQQHVEKTRGEGTDKAMCIEKCPEGYILGKHSGVCVQRTVSDPCDGATITSSDPGNHLQDCTIIRGNLEIMVTAGRNVSRQLERNLGQLRVITGYLRVVGASALLSLSFLKHLRLIKGEETAFNGCSFCVVENSNLEELWNWESRSTNLTINGYIFVAFNDRLCGEEVKKLVTRCGLSPDQTTIESNGKNAQCEIFHSPLTAVPGEKPGSVKLTWFHNYCGIDIRYTTGYYIYYRPTDQNITVFEERDVCNDRMLWWREHLKFENNHYASQCLSIELEDLEPATRYAIYAKTVATDNRALQTDLVYVTTYDLNPDQPHDGKVVLEGDELVLSWEGSFSRSSSGFYEVAVHLQPERKIGEFRYHEDCQKFDYDLSVLLGLHTEEENVTDIAESQKKYTAGKKHSESACPCDEIDLEEEAYLQLEKIEIENEISRLYHISSDERLNETMPAAEINSSSSFQEPINATASENTCLDGFAPPGLCPASTMNWKDAPLRFDKLAVLAGWATELLPHESNMTVRVTDAKLNITLLHKIITPTKITIQVRACVGEMTPCAPLNISSSCALCSDYYTRIIHKLEESPRLNVNVVLLTSGNDNKGVRNTATDCKRPMFLTTPDFSAVNLKKTTKLIQTTKSVFTDTEVANNFKNLSDINEFGADPELKEEWPKLRILWDTQGRLDSAILGYRIHYYELDAAQRERDPICLSKLAADELENKILVRVNPAKSYWVGVQVRNPAGYGPVQETCIQISGRNLDLYVAGVAAFLIALLVVALVIYTYVMKKPVISTINPSYGEPYLKHIRPDLRIPSNMLEITSESLGEGQFGIVFLGTLTIDDMKVPVAVKTVKETHVAKDREDMMNDLINEAIRIQHFESSFVTKLLGVNVDPKDRDLFLIFEYMDQKDLKKFLKEAEPDVLTEEVMVQLAVQIADGMAYISKQNYIHGDLAARNCMVGSQNDKDVNFLVKVSDFGLTRYLDSDYYAPKTTKKLFPVRWLAPECLTKNCFSKRSDVWSYGVLLWEILNKGELPYGKYTNEEVMEKVKSGEVSLIAENSKSDFLSRRMQDCLQRKPDLRPTFLQIVRIMLSRVSTAFRSEFQKLSFFDSPDSCDSESTEGFDEGCFVGSSLNASQEEDEPVTTSLSVSLQPCDVTSNSSLTQEDFTPNRSSCLSLSCGVTGTLNCTGKRFLYSEEILCPK